MVDHSSCPEKVPPSAPKAATPPAHRMKTPEVMPVPNAALYVPKSPVEVAGTEHSVNAPEQTPPPPKL